MLRFLSYPVWAFTYESHLLVVLLFENPLQTEKLSSEQLWLNK